MQTGEPGTAMKVGDLVKKISGDSDLNKTGIVVEIVHNRRTLGDVHRASSTQESVIVRVLTGAGVKNWYADLLQVID